MEEIRIVVDTREVKEWLSQYIYKVNNLKEEEDFKVLQETYEKYPDWAEIVDGLAPSKEFLDTFYKGLVPVEKEVDKQFEYIIVQEKIPYGTNSVWGGEVTKKSFVKDGNLITEMYQERYLPFICQLNGYNYYLGDITLEEMEWEEAMEYCSNLGEGWELPSREIMVICNSRPSVRELFREGWYWTSTEADHNRAFYQHFSRSSYQGFQGYYGKTNSHSVRPVYKKKATKLMEVK